MNSAALPPFQTDVTVINAKLQEKIITIALLFAWEPVKMYAERK